jgi:hypothetical protein
MPDLAARPPSTAVVSALRDRKPYLLHRLAAQLLPPLPPADPAERLGIDLSALRTAEHFQEALRIAWAGVARGEIAPAEALRIARLVRARLRARRRLARLTTRLAQRLR